MSNLFALVALLIPHLINQPALGAAPSKQQTRCKPACLRGTCNEELGRCDCPRHLSGPGCATQLPLAQTCRGLGFTADECTAVTPGRCLNACNDRGTCYNGFCHCQDGYYGADCSLSIDAAGQATLLEGLDYKPAARGPRIYVYELPPQFNTWRNIEKFDRPLYAHLWKRITSSGHRTLDGDIADYYYLPTDFRYLFGGAGAAIRYVSHTWPWWNATGGARHLLLSTSDLGGCEGAQLMRIRNATARSVWLTPWGLTRKHPRVWWPGCHRPGQDIVFPIPAQTNDMLLTPLNPRAPKPPRNITFFFSGKICGDNLDPREPPLPADADARLPPASSPDICQTPTNPLYSAGMRQQVFYHHARRPGYRIVPRSKTYATDMASSQFCLAPTGGGHGKRQVLVARFGCIPVTVTDYVMQPYEPELPWDTFSVPIQEAGVPSLHKVLAGISPEKIADMQRRVACASLHLWWSSLWGGIFGEDGRYDAFATLIEILRVRAAHPHADPRDYRRLDERFRRFSDCELGADGPAHGHVDNQEVAAGAGPAAPALCTYGYDPHATHLAPTPYCAWRMYGKYGIPGGAICQGAPHIAACPRP